MRTGATSISGTLWRSLVVGAGYLFALVATGIISGLLGAPVPAETSGAGLLLLLGFLSGVLMGLFLGPLAARMPASRRRQFWVWTCVLFFNSGSVAIEGAYFAPDLVPIPLPILIIQQLVAAAVVALLITRLWIAPGVAEAPSLREVLSRRSWPSWTWRFVAASLSYLLAYYVFGTINFRLFTQPYYDGRIGGLTVPAPSVVWAAEGIRAPMIVFSVVLFVFSMQTARPRVVLLTGVMLFWVGGVIPLLLQVSAFPLPFIIASGIEIFFQNFVAGAVTAFLFWTARSNAENEGGHPMSSRSFVT